VLLGWPVLSILFYKRFNTIKATFFTIVGGYLLLPVKVEVDLPLIPAFDKSSIPVLSAMIGCFLIKKLSIKLLPTQMWQRIFVLILIISPLLTVLTNSNPVFNGRSWISGLTLHDSTSAILDQYIRVLPFIIVSQIIKSDTDFILVCKLFVISGLVYSLPILFEVRMSPQLHTWIYGFFPHSFSQQVRFDGFRPVVFLGHGLLVAIYMMVTFALSCLLWKRNIRVSPSFPPIFTMLFLLFILLISKSVAAFLFGLTVFFAVIFLSSKLNKSLTLLILFFVMFYPALCIFDLFPHTEIIDYVLTIDADRAQSLDFRFYHESRLLEHAREQVLFGWGGWGRNRLAGSVTDGRWIIEFGMYGIAGFVALFGLFGSTIIKALQKASLSRIKAQSDTLLISALTLSLILVDQIVNSSLGIWVWFFTGALLGRASNMQNFSIKVKK